MTRRFVDSSIRLAVLSHLPACSSLRLLLLPILLCAGILRFYGLDWGTDRQTGDFHRFHPDEVTLLHNARALEAGLDRAHTAYGRLPAYTLYAVARVAGALSGRDLLDLQTDSGARFAFTLARATSALLSTLTVLVVFGIGRRAAQGLPAPEGHAATGRLLRHPGDTASPSADALGLAAATVLACTPGHIQQAHYFTADTPFAFWTALGLYTVLGLPSARRGPYLLCGLACGLAAGTRLLAGLLALPFLAAHLLPPAPNRIAGGRREAGASLWGRVRQAVSINALLCAATVAALAVASEPLLLLDPGAFLRESDMRDFMPSVKVTRGESLRVWTLYDLNTTPWLFYVTHLLRYAMGAPLEAIALAGLLWGLGRRRRLAWVLGAWVIAYGFVVGGFFAKPIRYTTPMLPALAVAAAWFGLRMGASLRSRLSLPVPVAVPLLLLLLPSAAYGTAVALTYGREDSRIRAARWIRDYIPPGSAVLVERGGFPTEWMVPEGRYRRRPDLGSLFIRLQGHVTNVHIVATVDEMLKDVDYWVLIRENRMRPYLSAPDDFPVAFGLYDRLVRGKLGFERAAFFDSPPSLPGWEFTESGAEPTLTAFDRPAVEVFGRVRSPAGELRDWTASLSAGPQTPDGAVEEGAKAFSAGNYAKALALFRAAKKADPRFTLAGLLASQALLRLGRAEEATAEWANTGPSWWDFIGMVDVGLHREGADYLYRVLAESDLDSEEGAYVRAECAEAYFRAGLAATDRDADAALCYTRSIEVDPQNAGPYLNLADIHTRAGDHDQAVRALRQGLERLPDRPRLHMALGQALVRADSLDAALAAAETALDLSPGYADARTVLLMVGGASYDAGRLDLAEQVYLSAIEHDPGLPLAWYNLGVIRLESGRAGPAVEALREAHRLAPGDARAERLLQKALLAR